jgi:hypothetical protein
MSQIEQRFHGDRPIESPGEDRLGFRPAAEHVAKAIQEMASPDGFVIGIEGEWGSGKSSFINLVSDSLRQFDDAPEIVRFLPWLISSRQALLKELFPEIIKAALRIESEEPANNWRAKLSKRLGFNRYSTYSTRKKKLKELFSKFSGRLVQAGKVADAFGASGSTAIVQASKHSIDSWLESDSLDKEKSQIQIELRTLSRKIVIFIDDLDRLEPAEVTEILRLVRAVVDFPNVVFVLCYSLDIISRNLASALKIQRGEEFLEKIIQVSFTVPRPEAFDLRRMLRHELELLYPDLLADESPQARSIQKRLAGVIDGEGGRALLTPRQVIRAVNALRFYSAPVLAEIDIPDMVWLQLIRLQSSKLHQWIEHYLIEFSAKNVGALITDEGKAADLARLESIIDELDQFHGAREARRLTLADMLPGVDFSYVHSDDDKAVALSIYEKENLSPLIRDRRLGSPHHFRYYFAFTPPKSAISDREFSIFIAKAQTSPTEAAEHFVALTTKMTQDGRIASQPIIDRLKDEGLTQVPIDALPGLIEALAASMDIAAMRIGAGDWGTNWIWQDAGSLLDSMLSCLDKDTRQPLVRRIFGSGAALAWLTDVFRNEIFSHGIYGDRAEPESEWTLSSSELEIAATELLRRYRELTPAELDRLPKVSPLLYAWAQYEHGSQDEIRRKVSYLCEQDANFLKVLEGMRGWKNTNGIVSFPLNREHLSLFLDVERARKRLLKLSRDMENPQIARQAQDLVDALDHDTSRRDQ